LKKYKKIFEYISKPILALEDDAIIFEENNRMETLCNKVNDKKFDYVELNNILISFDKECEKINIDKRTKPRKFKIKYKSEKFEII
jgi:hypothetical protein